MKELLRNNLVRSLLPLGLSCLLLVMLLCGLSRATKAVSQVSSWAPSQEGTSPGPLGYRIGVPVCQQARNQVRNHSFEEGSGDPWKPSYWDDDGDCTFSYDDPGPDSAVAAEISDTPPREKYCRLRNTPLGDFPVEPGRFYDFSAQMQADLSHGDAYPRVVFYKWQDDHWQCVGIMTPTVSVTDTDGAWVEVAGSAQAPPDAGYAVAEAFLPKSSEGSVWFDDVYLGLATCLEIEKSDDPPEVEPGDKLTYTITYSNTGREEATNVLIEETYHWKYVYPIDDTGAVWLIPRLPAGEGDTIIAKTRVQTDTGERKWLFNTVQITSEETIRPDEDTISTSLKTGPDGCAIYVDFRSVEQTAGLGYTVDYHGALRNAGSCAGDVVTPVAISSLGWDVKVTPKLWPRHVLSAASIPITVSLSIPTNAADARVDTTTLTATLNCGSPCNKTATATRTVTTTVRTKVFLPVILRCWPFIPPVLHAIDNDDINGSYEVCWSHPCAVTYALEEATDSAFADATPIYTGTSTCHFVTDQGPGWYYYRVKACNSEECTDWSNDQGVGAWWEQEDNDLRTDANGPLISCKDYHGRHDDVKDWFSVGPLDADDQVTMELVTGRSTGVWLQLWDELSEEKGVCQIKNPPHDIACDIEKAGRYYVCVRTKSEPSSDTYTLHVEFP